MQTDCSKKFMSEKERETLRNRLWETEKKNLERRLNSCHMEKGFDLFHKSTENK